MPAHEPDGATTKSQGANVAITCSAISRVVARSPELKAGWPQQLCGGTSTVQPASSKSFTAAKPTDGRIMSTRQVTNRPTRLSGSAIDAPRQVLLIGDIGGKGLIPQVNAADHRQDSVPFQCYHHAMAIVRWVLIIGVCGYALVVAVLYFAQR